MDEGRPTCPACALLTASTFDLDPTSRFFARNLPVSPFRDPTGGPSLLTRGTRYTLLFPMAPRPPVPPCCPSLNMILTARLLLVSSSGGAAEARAHQTKPDLFLMAFM